MTNEPRWSVNELIARYTLEPDLSDVFVEGCFDREVLSRANAGIGNRASFYEIDVVDVSGEILKKYGLSSGNKQRVIALSKELGGLPLEAKVFCLADRDLDHWLDVLECTSRLRWTLFCCMESHFLTPESICDILIVAGRAKISGIDKFTKSIYSILKNLFALRLADSELKLTLKWVSLKKYLHRSGDTISLDTSKYITATLSSNAKLSQKLDFHKSFNVWQETLNCDIRMAARGHDYTEILAWSISEFNGQRELATPVAVERLFVLLARSVPTIASEIE
jgi:hypothetical protein